MAYCDEDDVRMLLPQVGQFLRDGETTVDDQIALAQSWADSRLMAMGYDVPFTGAVPEEVRSLTATRTCILLIRRVPNLAGSGWLEDFRRDAKEMLDDLRSCRAETPEDDKIADYAQGLVVNAPTGSGRRFTAERLRDL